MIAYFATRLAATKVEEPRGFFDRAWWELTEPLLYVSPLLGKFAEQVPARVGRVFESDSASGSGEKERAMLVEVPAGFRTDYSSVPRLPFAFLFFGDTAHKAATGHDWLVENGVEWMLAADVFEEALRAEGVAEWRISWMSNAVRANDPAVRGDQRYIS